MAETDWVDVDAKQETKIFEGFSSKVYKDTKGKRTVGYGFNIDDPVVSKSVPLDVKAGLRGITQEESDIIFDKLYARANKDAVTFLGKDTFNKLPAQARNSIVDMSYNMGLNKLSEFKKMKKALEAGNFEQAAIEMKDSAWFSQVGNRSKKHFETMSGMTKKVEEVPNDFKSAFSNARKQGLKEFDWNGKRYTTEVR